MTPHPAPLRARMRCHPATAAGVALTLSVEVQANAGSLQVRYALRGDTSALRIPAAAASVPTDGLWQHTCFEAFVAADGDTAYQEFNFSPSSEWAAYRFSTERQRDTVAEAAHPTRLPAPLVSITPRGLTLTARVPVTALPRGPSVLTIGLCAVIEERDGRLSYWALHHPAQHPDFHHPDGRAMRLASPLN